MTKIIIAGGGTGGHIFPAIAIANAIKQLQPNTDILFIGAKGKMEMQKIPEAGYKIQGINIAGYNRSSLFKNILLPFKILKSFRQVKTIFNEFTPDAVVGVGGYSSFPVLRYAQRKSIPTFIHESNSFAGKSNILLSKKARKIFVAGDGMEKFFPSEKIMVTGNPVRKSIAQSSVSREEANRFFQLNENTRTILVVGGSLGARSINEAIAAHLREFRELGLQLIWQTGSTAAEGYIQRGKPWKNVWVNEFIKEMDKAYAAADIVVSRAGAMAVTELSVTGKAVIFVPYPYAAEDHQTANALHLVNKKAALMVKDSEVRIKLLSAIVDLAMNVQLTRELEENIKKLAVKNADEKIAAEILENI